MFLQLDIEMKLRQVFQESRDQERFLSREQIARCSQGFRDRFGPDLLSSLDGEALLNTMHDLGNKESLVYWLEFKNDEEMPEYFGSISGGSALKYRVYKRRETGKWTTGSPHGQREISTDEAVAIARQNRDELVRAARLIGQLEQSHDYVRLQQELDRVAPYASQVAWCHKYLSVLYPDLIDSFHNLDFQRFYLNKLRLQVPTDLGRYSAAEYFVSAVSDFDMPLQNFTELLMVTFGRPYRYWRVGTTDGEEPSNRWPLMRDGACAAIGYPDLGDLTGLLSGQLGREEVQARLDTHYPTRANVVSRKAREVCQFVAEIKTGDLILAADGLRVLGVGRVTGDYAYERESDFPHRRQVEWLDELEWPLPESEGLQTTVHEIRKPANRTAAEARLTGAAPGNKPTAVPASVSKASRPQLPEMTRRIQSVLERKGQIILYGPPGTGKTHWAESAARDLAASHWFGRLYGELDAKEQAVLTGPNGAVAMCCFHPAYGYEDFIEGYRPQPSGSQMAFRPVPGIFRQMCALAAGRSDRPFYLIIDEINRGDIPRIFGELITLLELNKRGKEVLLPLTGERFAVPRNLYLIGTMNTADRSIALLDTALRRRFGFVELMPDYDVLQGGVVDGIPVGGWLRELNRRIIQHVGRDARNLQIGHSYFLRDGHPVSDAAIFARIVEEELLPLLQEYCYEDYATLEKVLGSDLVDAGAQALRYDLFAPSRWDRLRAALLQPCPDLSASRLATEAAAEGDANADDESGSEAS